MPEASFGKGKRLLDSTEFQSVFDSARYKVSHRHFLILATPNQKGYPRLGLVIGKKNIRLAVQRNRVKRVVRETFRRRQENLGSVDIVFLARKGFDSLLPSLQTSIMQETWEKLANKVKRG